jgi:hypothetical protein
MTKKAKAIIPDRRNAAARAWNPTATSAIRTISTTETATMKPPHDSPPSNPSEVRGCSTNRAATAQRKASKVHGCARTRNSWVDVGGTAVVVSNEWDIRINLPIRTRIRQRVMGIPTIRLPHGRQRPGNEDAIVTVAGRRARPTHTLKAYYARAA